MDTLHSGQTDLTASSSKDEITGGHASRATRKAVIAPSILAADFSQLGEEVTSVSDAEWIHIDVMDGHFVPNLSFGLPVAQSLVGKTQQHLDVHLMIADPERWAPDYAADFHSVTFHLEAVRDVDAAIVLADKLRSQGTLAGVSVKPGTPVEPLLDKLEHFDLVLVMSVEPGFGGQAFMPEVLEKVRALRTRIDADGLDTLIEIDGGIGVDSAIPSAAAGVDVFVAGSSVFGKLDRAQAITDLRRAVQQGIDSGDAQLGTEK